MKQPIITANLVGEYFHGVSYGFVFFTISIIYNIFFAAVGRSHIILYFTVISTILNIALTYYFMFGGLDLGIFGAGIAMSITSSIMLMLKIVYLTQRNFHCYNLFKFHKNILTYVVPVFKMGIPISIQQSSEILFFTVITYFMGIAGVGALVAQQISGQITIVVVSVVIAVSQSVSILIAHNIKRNNSDNIRDFIQIALAVGTIIATMVLVVCVFFPQLPVRLYFKHGMHPADAFPLTKAVLCITGVYLLFDSIRNIVVGALRGFGDTKISMRISLVAFWCIALPLSYIFYQFSPLGAVGIKLGGMIAIIPATLYICYRLRQVQTSFSNG